MKCFRSVQTDFTNPPYSEYASGKMQRGESMKKTLSGLLIASALFTGACTTQTAADTANSTAAVQTSQEQTAEIITVSLTSNDSGILDTADMFTERDLEQTADLSEAVYYTVSDNETYTISEAGVYVFTGTAQNAQIIVEAADDDKVQIVIDDLSITNTDKPCIYVKNADKVFVTSVNENTLTVTGTFSADGDTNTDAVIFSKDDLVLNGTGSLTIASSDNGITSKDDLKVTGGTLSVTCVNDALEANDSIRIAGGDITISSKKDGLHAENDDDDTAGYIYIAGGSLNITAADDAIHAATVIQIDGGTLTLKGAECIEATYVQINDGVIDISASDDGINAGRKSDAFDVTIEITGGDITIVMGAGDTDGIDSNGNLIISGGTIDITANSPFDYDGTASYTGGTLIVNGTETTEITNQMMGGMQGMPQDMQGGMPGGMFGGFGGH